MGFAVWVNERDKVVWAQGTHEYRPLGTAVVAMSDWFRVRDFRPMRKRPAEVDKLFVGFFGSLEEVNHYLQHETKVRRHRRTPAHLL